MGKNINLLIFLILVITAYSQLQDLRYIGSYKPCWRDEDCKPNAFCLGGSPNRPAVCACREGYEIYRNATFYDCFKAKAAGEACNFDNECKIKLAELGVCDQESKTCTCEQGAAHVGPDGMCYKTRKLDEHCLIDYNCLLANGKYVYCDHSHICACPLMQRPSSDKLSCIPYKLLGQKCSADTECDFTLNAVCREICECNIGHSIARDGQRCLKAASQFGEPCEEDDQCSRFLERSICSNKTCRCERGYHGYLTNCIKSVELGGLCNENSDCVINDQHTKEVVCNEGICARKPDNSDSDKNDSTSIYVSYVCFTLFIITFRM